MYNLITQGGVVMNNDIGSNIKELSSMKGISQKQLAKLSDLTEATISRYVKGTRVPTVEVLSKIAKALDTTTEELLKSKKDASLGSTAVVASLGAALTAMPLLSPISLGIVTGFMTATAANKKKNNNSKTNNLLDDYQKNLLKFQKVSTLAIHDKLIDKNIAFSKQTISEENGTNTKPDYALTINNNPINSWWFIFWKESDSLNKHFGISKTERAALLLSKYLLTKPDIQRKSSIVVDDLELFNTLVSFKNSISYKGNLSIILIDLNEFEVAQELEISYFDSKPEDIISLM